MSMYIHRIFPLDDSSTDTVQPIKCKRCGLPPDLCVCCPTCGEYLDQCKCFAEPSGETNSVDPNELCDVCTEPIDICVCHPCQMCGFVGNPKCYVNHGARYTKAQLMSITQNSIDDLQTEIATLYAYLDELKGKPEDYTEDPADAFWPIV